MQHPSQADEDHSLTQRPPKIRRIRLACLRCQTRKIRVSAIEKPISYLVALSAENWLATSRAVPRPHFEYHCKGLSCLHHLIIPINNELPILTAYRQSVMEGFPNALLVTKPALSALTGKPIRKEAFHGGKIYN